MPDTPDAGGWDAAQTTDGVARFDSPDRRATILCEPVTTASGRTVNCRLYESDNPHAFGEPVTSVTTAQTGGLAAAVEHLTAQRSG